MGKLSTVSEAFKRFAPKLQGSRAGGRGSETTELVYKAVLRRSPNAEEIKLAQEMFDKGGRTEQLIEKLLKSQEARRYDIRLFMPPGHFYSPIVDTEALAPDFPRERATPPEKLLDVDIDLDAMTRLWDEALAPIVKRSPFSDQPDGKHRYHFLNTAYSYGDGTILRAMILHHKPKRIVEVGSGWSSACMLDTAFDEAKLNTEITFVEPYPALLKKMLRGDDEKRVKIIDQPVQKVPYAVFEQLEANDILFIDSTHVMKTRSDVTHELTEVLPRLKPGVVIHFHDIFYPFEYGYNWVIEHNRSWNELYAVRNFLAYNSKFKVIFFNDMFMQLRRSHLERDCPKFLENAGGAIWMQRVA